MTFQNKLNRLFDERASQDWSMLREETRADMWVGGFLKFVSSNLDTSISKQSVLELVAEKFDKHILLTPPIRYCPLIAQFAKRGLLQAISEVYDKHD